MSKKTHERRDFDEVFNDLNRDFRELHNRMENLEGSEGGGGTYALLRNEQTLGTAGGTFTSGAWQTRTLNTEVVDTGNFVSLAANQITLLAGNYRVLASAPAFRVANHQIRLQNITDATTIAVGTSEFADASAGENDQTRSILSYYFTLTSTKVLELQHRCTTTKTTNGFGQAASFDIEVYAVLELWRI